MFDNFETSPLTPTFNRLSEGHKETPLEVEDDDLGYLSGDAQSTIFKESQYSSVPPKSPKIIVTKFAYVHK